MGLEKINDGIPPTFVQEAAQRLKTSGQEPSETRRNGSPKGLRENVRIIMVWKV